MESTRILIQDARNGLASVFLRELIEQAAAIEPNLVQVATAYITLGGARELIQNLSHIPSFLDARKQWLTSVDFGHTYPSALTYLSKLPNSEVRISDGDSVIHRGLKPLTSFHPKAYLFERCVEGQSSMVRALVVGSANLTRRALLTNAEQGTTIRQKIANRAQSGHDLMPFKLWWDMAWPVANTLDDEFLGRYKNVRSNHRSPPDRVNLISEYHDRSNIDVTVSQGIGWSYARCFWIETHELYKNRGAGRPGNQVDARRGSRVYFGFSPRQVPRNTVFGEVFIQYGNKTPVNRSVRFGNNSMDKINLPIPGRDGPESYDNTVLHFERVGNGVFRLTLGSAVKARKWRKMSNAQGMMGELNDRKFGFYS